MSAQNERTKALNKVTFGQITLERLDYITDHIHAKLSLDDYKLNLADARIRAKNCQEYLSFSQKLMVSEENEVAEKLRQIDTIDGDIAALEKQIRQKREERTNIQEDVAFSRTYINRLSHEEETVSARLNELQEDVGRQKNNVAQAQETLKKRPLSWIERLFTLILPLV